MFNKTVILDANLLFGCNTNVVARVDGDGLLSIVHVTQLYLQNKKKIMNILINHVPVWFVKCTNKLRNLNSKRILHCLAFHYC
jgi:hypothetical protein